MGVEDKFRFGSEPPQWQPGPAIPSGEDAEFDTMPTPIPEQFPELPPDEGPFQFRPIRIFQAHQRAVRVAHNLPFRRRDPASGTCSPVA